MSDRGQVRAKGSRAARQASQVASLALQVLQEALRSGQLSFNASWARTEPLRATWEWWQGLYLSRFVGRKTIEQIWRDYLLPELGELKPVELTPARVESLLARLEPKLGPRSLNAVRGTLRRVLKDAAANQRWWGPNPAESVRPRRVPLKHWPTLDVDEARRLLELRGPQRILWALALYLGLRKGELFALRRGDIDERERTVFVQRSHERSTTKNGRARLLPLCSELWPFVAEHLATLPADPQALLFPNARGGLRRRDAKLSHRLRTALKACGAVVGFRFTCRQCGHSEDRPDGSPARCIRCETAYWREPVPRHLRFYDLRHTFNTLARRAGVSKEARRMTMGHAGSVTDSYDQWAPHELRDELEKLRLRADPANSEAPTAGTVEASMGKSDLPGNPTQSGKRDSNPRPSAWEGDAHSYSGAGIPVHLAEPSDTCAVCPEKAALRVDENAFCMAHLEAYFASRRATDAELRAWFEKIRRETGGLAR